MPMKAYQITLPAQNKPGILATVTSVLAREKINIRAISITSFGQSGFFHMIVDDPERGQRVLNKAGIAAELKEILAVLIPDRPGGLDKLVQTLAAEKINVENAYGFVIESRKNAVFVIDVQNPEETKTFLKKAGYQIISSRSLSEIEPFHYMKY